MTAPRFGLSEIGQIAITAKDVDRAAAWYRDVLALPFLFAAPGLAFFQAGTVRLMITRVESPEFDHAASILYFRVADIAAAHRELTARGVEFRSAPHVVHRTDAMELWLADFFDCERNTFALMEERKK
ncbi:MAG TPA: VOC family protein [Gemmatimonadaceae bacterium]|nr:VOC family protein [Gemmatimonadaceae bacterium]